MSNITNNPSVPSQVVAEVKFPNFITSLGIIPTSYKDSMSYYECLAWLCKFLEETVIPTVNENGLAVEELQALYVQLNEYVSTYFENLDVQDEINNKLDEMVEEGTLQEIISEYLQTKAIFCYDTVNDMKEATNLINGSYAKTLGYYEKNDGGEAIYYISDTPGSYYEELENGLYANIVLNDIISVKQFGAKGDGINDDTIAINTAIENANNEETLIFPTGTYLCNISCNKPLNFDFQNSLLVPATENTLLSISGTKEDIGYILYENVKRYDKSINVRVTPSDIQAGDFILIRDDSKRPSDDLLNINEEVHEVQEVNNNIIILKDFIRYKKEVATESYNVYKLNVIKNVTIKNLKMNINSERTGFFGRYLVNVNIDNIQAENNINPAIAFYSSVNININNFKIENARDFTGGKGYGILLDHGCNNWKISNGYGSKLRHLVDPSSSFDGKIENVIATDMQQVSFGFAHNTYGSDITYENCHCYSQKWYGFDFSKQGVTDRNSFTGFNFNIIDCSVIYTDNESNQIGAMFECPVENSVIENFTVKGTGNGIGIRLNPINNIIDIKNCFIDNVQTGMFIEETAVAEKTDKNYMININNVNINNCGYGVRFANVKEISFDKITASNITTSLFHFGAYSSAKTQQLKHINITNCYFDNVTAFIGFQGTREYAISDSGVFGKIANNIKNTSLPIEITCEAGGRIVTNDTSLYTLVPTPNDLYFPITSESAITLATASLSYAIAQYQKCIIHNIGEYNITIPQSFLMENYGSNYILEPNKSISYIYIGTKWYKLIQ